MPGSYVETYSDCASFDFQLIDSSFLSNMPQKILINWVTDQPFTPCSGRWFKVISVPLSFFWCGRPESVWWPSRWAFSEKCEKRNISFLFYVHRPLLNPTVDQSFTVKNFNDRAAGPKARQTLAQSWGTGLENPQCGALVFQYFRQFEENQRPSLFRSNCSEAIH